MKTNKDRIIEELNKYELKLGAYDELINKLNKNNLTKIINEIRFCNSTDVDIFINRVLHIVEIAFVDNEVDFMVLTKEEYISRYGDERWDD